MIIALLVCLAATVTTGLMGYRRVEQRAAGGGLGD
jgi:hypothetical protein